MNTSVKRLLLGVSLMGSLLPMAPAFAASSPFTVYFDPQWGSTESTGSTAEAVFTIDTTSQAGKSLVNITLKNTTQAPPTSTLVALGFATPTGLTFSSFTGTQIFTDFFQGQDAQINGGPFLTFDFCTRVEGGNNCNGGNLQAGLTNDQSDGPIVFEFLDSLARNESTLADDFKTLFGLNGTPPTYQIAARFQQVDPGGSDKVGGGPDPGANAPGDGVPGPVPLLGAAAAYGYSRRLRRRLRASASDV